jgi:hypothetical protein|tara:strand:- start:434 stop:709 length:276 start_codon:yes stop_codon:yes gene_type:complete
MKTREKLLDTLGKIEANLNKSRTTVNKIGRLKVNDWEVNELKNSLARIQELLGDIESDDKPEPEPEPENEARKALRTGDWGSFFDSLTQPK